jgi:hypothetical protein
MLLLVAGMAITSSAQRRGTRVTSVIYRPIIIRRPFFRDPFWYSRYYYDPYFYDPYLRDRRDRYYREKAVRDARRELARHRERYGADGIITAKEREELIENEDELAKAIRKLNRFNARY